MILLFNSAFGVNVITTKHYLTEFNHDAQEMSEQLIRQYAKIEGVNEYLKHSDQMEWTWRMNSIRNRVEAFVLSDFIYA